MDAHGFVDFLNQVINSFVNVGNWLITPIQIGDLSLSPIMLCTFGGLIAFVGAAVIKWVIS